jgi:hypothetical protein
MRGCINEGDTDVAGDGTTTATILARAIYREGAKLVVAGVTPLSIKRGIDKAVLSISQLYGVSFCRGAENADASEGFMLSIPELRAKAPLTIVKRLNCYRLKLWDEDLRKIIAFL